MYREAKAINDPVDPSTPSSDPPSVAYVNARGKWSGALDLGWGSRADGCCSACTPSEYYGPDRNTGFTRFPAMSMASSARVSTSSWRWRHDQLHDWYADLPWLPAVFGDRPTF